jgi:hypothetical protein
MPGGVASQMPRNTPDAVGRKFEDVDRSMQELQAALSTVRGSALWLPRKVYQAGDLVVAPDGTLVVVLEAHTSGATFEPNLANIPARWQTVRAPSPSSPVFSATQNTAQTGVALNTWTAVAFDAETIDTHSGHDNAASPSRYTIPAGWGGTWQFQGTVAIAGTGGGGVVLAVNGTRVKGSVVSKPSGGAGAFATPAKQFTVAAGDYVGVFWYLDAPTGTYVQTDFASSFDGRFVQ